MSEWEEFAAYRGIIADAKREERERIITIINNALEMHKFESIETYTEYDSGWSDALNVILKVINK